MSSRASSSSVRSGGYGASSFMAGPLVSRLVRLVGCGSADGDGVCDALGGLGGGGRPRGGGRGGPGRRGGQRGVVALAGGEGAVQQREPGGPLALGLEGEGEPA